MVLLFIRTKPELEDKDQADVGMVLAATARRHAGVGQPHRRLSILPHLEALMT